MNKKVVVEKLENTKRSKNLTNKKNVNEKSDENIQKKVFLNKFEESKKQYKEGKISNAKSVFKELREKYGY